MRLKVLGCFLHSILFHSTVSFHYSSPPNPDSLFLVQRSISVARSGCLHLDFKLTSQSGHSCTLVLVYNNHIAGNRNSRGYWMASLACTLVGVGQPQVQGFCTFTMLDYQIAAWRLCNTRIWLRLYVIYVAVGNTVCIPPSSSWYHNISGGYNYNIKLLLPNNQQ